MCITCAHLVKRLSKSFVFLMNTIECWSLTNLANIFCYLVPYSQLCDPYFSHLLFSYKIAIFEEIPWRMPLIILDTWQHCNNCEYKLITQSLHFILIFSSKLKRVNNWIIWFILQNSVNSSKITIFSVCIYTFFVFIMKQQKHSDWVQ